jgi:hypothetical protein
LCIITLSHQDESLTDAHAQPGGGAKSPEAANLATPTRSRSVCVTPSTPPTPDVPPEDCAGVGGKEGTGGCNEGARGTGDGLSTPPTPHVPPSSQASAAGGGGEGGGGGGRGEAVEECAGRGSEEGAGGGGRVLLQQGGLRQVENALDMEQERRGKGMGTHGEGGDTHGEGGGTVREGLSASMNEWLHTLAKILKRTPYSDFIK